MILDRGRINVKSGGTIIISKTTSGKWFYGKIGNIETSGIEKGVERFPRLATERGVPYDVRT
jgi:hypothetical protein